MKASGKIHVPASLKSGGRSPWYALDNKLDGQQNRYSHCRYEKNLLPWGGSNRLLGRPALSLVAIPTQLYACYHYRLHLSKNVILYGNTSLKYVQILLKRVLGIMEAYIIDWIRRVIYIHVLLRIRRLM